MKAVSHSEADFQVSTTKGFYINRQYVILAVSESRGWEIENNTGIPIGISIKHSYFSVEFCGFCPNASTKYA